MSSLFDNIKDILVRNIPKNISNEEVVLSVGESLLLVIDACKKADIGQSILTQLYRLYLEGVKNDNDRVILQEIKGLLEDKNFTVKSDPRTVSEDPTRRYFETQLAYFTLQESAGKLNHDELEVFTQNLKNRLLSLSTTERNFPAKVEKILAGDIDAKVLNKYELEYAELTQKLLKNDFYGLSEKACKNLYQIACSTILATLNTQIDQSMPANIYNDSIFTMGMDGRGRKVKPDQDEVKTTVKGLMKSTSPLPLYYDVVNPVEENYTETTKSPFLRSADQADFMIESSWSQQLFFSQIHPYSNGISSTTLAQVRNMILEKRVGNPHHNDIFQQYMTVFASLMLYNSGGHSFFEIFEVLKLPICQELLSSEAELKKELDSDSLMYKFLCMDQTHVYEEALQSTQSYMQVLLKKKMLNAQFKAQTKNKDNANGEAYQTEMSWEIKLHEAVLTQNTSELDHLLEDSQGKEIDVPNHKKWTALMVASQLGKTEHVEKLIAAGADITKRVDGLSSLELAIKSQNFSTVSVLLKHGAIVKRENEGSLKERLPALYLACRQSDMRILKSLLEKEKIEMKDKVDAILTAIKIENLAAAQVLLANLTFREQLQFYTKKFVSILLSEAVVLGNIELIEGMLFEFAPDLIDYDGMLIAAAKNRYLPVIQYLLNKYADEMSNQALEKALLAALESKNFKTAILLIIHGANPEVIPSDGLYLKSFNLYLKNSKQYDFLFAQEEYSWICQRKDEIQKIQNERGNPPLYDLLIHLVAFLNDILPDSLRIGYNDKAVLMGSFSSIFAKKSSFSANDERPIHRGFISRSHIGGELKVGLRDLEGKEGTEENERKMPIY